MKYFFSVVLAFTIFFINAEPTLLIFGDRNNKVFLGCLNCSQYSSTSIWNEYGTYGSEYSTTSIWNTYGIYGSPYSTYSVFNQYTQTPPVVVDQNGRFYGRLSCNTYITQPCNLNSCNLVKRHCENSN